MLYDAGERVCRGDHASGGRGDIKFHLKNDIGLVFFSLQILLNGFIKNMFAAIRAFNILGSA
jgi:hypothetical protein